jgi:alpha-ketoglutarate-dependent taurine dioxygenase
LLGYLAQYQPQALLTTLEKTGLPADHVYQAAVETAQNLPSQDYRRLSKTWAVRRLRYRKIPKPQ